MQDRHKMTATLETLIERAATLDDTIKDMDHQIERAMHAVAGGTDDIGHAMEVLTERRNAQLGCMFELGKTQAQIEDLENRIQELDERGLERQAAQEWENAVPMAQEDNLDWLKPVLDAPLTEQTQEERHHNRDGEERESEDYLDWLKR